MHHQRRTGAVHKADLGRVVGAVNGDGNFLLAPRAMLVAHEYRECFRNFLILIKFVGLPGIQLVKIGAVLAQIKRAVLAFDDRVFAVWNALL